MDVTTEEGEEEAAEVNVLEMSDADFEKEMDKGFPKDATEETVEASESVVEETSTEEATDVVEEEDNASEETVEASDDTIIEEEANTEEAEEESAVEDDEDKAENKGDAEEATLDFEAEYKRVLAPFKANGKDIQVESVDDAISLMQMGANYNKKMVGLKPNLKLMKMLENNGLLDEGKLNYLIDLSKKNPQAITKLIKDSGLDPLDIETEGEEEYTPNAYTVNDNEVELDGILAEIRGTDSYNTTLDIIGTKWDDSSKQVVSDDPSIIKVINEQVQSGVYAQINTVVERERMLGRLQGKSDIEAYVAIGKAIQANGGFKEAQPVSDVTVPPIVAPTKTVDSAKLAKKKKAASSTKSAPSKKKVEYNPLSMSDEEFEKLASSNYM